MKYILKLRVPAQELAQAIQEGLKQEYGIDTQQVKKVAGALRLDTNYYVYAFNVHLTDNELGTSYCIAIGYEDGPKYRIYAHITEYCPHCQMHGIRGPYCHRCGTKTEYQLA